MSDREKVILECAAACIELMGKAHMSTAPPVDTEQAALDSVADFGAHVVALVTEAIAVGAEQNIDERIARVRWALLVARARQRAEGT